MRTVLITGSHSACNKGAAALVVVASLGMRRRLGNVRIVVASPFPAGDRRAYEPYGCCVIRSWRRHLPFCGAHMLLSSLTPSGAPAMITAESRATRDAALVIDVSGDGFSEDYGPHVVMSHLYPVWLALRCGRQVCLSAQTLGPLRATRSWVRLLLDRTALITVRDDLSVRTLAELGVCHPRIERVADLAFLLDPAPSEMANRVAAQAPEGFWTRPVLGLTISSLGGQRSAFGRELPLERFLNAYAEGIHRVVSELDLAVFLVAHRTGPRPRHDDRPLTRLLRDRLHAQRPGRVWMLDGDTDCALVKALIGRCHIFCAQRLHSGIAALSMGVPTVMIGCAPKARELMRQMNLVEDLLTLETFTSDALVSKLRRLWSRRDEVRRHLQRRLVEVRSASERALDLAAALVPCDPRGVTDSSQGKRVVKNWADGGSSPKSSF